MNIETNKLLAEPDKSAVTLLTEKEQWLEDWGCYEKDEEVIENDDEINEFGCKIQPPSETNNQNGKDGWIEILQQFYTFVPGDIIEFLELVWDKDFRKKAITGFRTNEIELTKITFDKNLTERIYFRALKSEGSEPISINKTTWRYHHSLIKCKCCRKLWTDESQRDIQVEYFKKHKKEVYNEWHKNYALKEEEFNINKIKGLKDDKPREIVLNELPEEEREWLSNWHKNVVLDKSMYGFGRWSPEMGWRQLHNTDDIIFVEDIILYWHPFFSGRYPHGKYIGKSMVVTKITKIGRKYYYGECICSYNNSISEGKTIKVKFERVYYWGTYRLNWKNEKLRNLQIGKKS